MELIKTLDNFDYLIVEKKYKPTYHYAQAYYDKKSSYLGYVWAPYIAMHLTEPIINENFQPREAIQTRYANRIVNPNFYTHVT